MNRNNTSKVWNILHIVIDIVLILLLIASGHNIYYNNTKDSEKPLITTAQYELLNHTYGYGILLSKVISTENHIRGTSSRIGRYNKRDSLSRKEMEEYVSLLYTYQQTESLDVMAFIANTSSESRWNKNANSPVGAKGLNQVMPLTFNETRIKLDRYTKGDILSVYDNTEVAVKYWIGIRNYLHYTYGVKPKPYEIAMAYNCGPFKFTQVRNRYGKHVSYEELVSSPYFAEETRNHAKKVMYYYTNYNESIFNIDWQTRNIGD